MAILRERCIRDVCALQLDLLFPAAIVIDVKVKGARMFAVEIHAAVYFFEQQLK